MLKLTLLPILWLLVKKMVHACFSEISDSFCWCFWVGKPLISFPLNIWSPLPCSKVDEDLVKNSGKFLLLDRMLPELKKRGHKVKLKILEGWDTVISLWTKNVIKESFWFCRSCCSHKWLWCLTFWWITVTWETSNLVDWMALCPTQREKKM